MIIPQIQLIQAMCPHHSSEVGLRSFCFQTRLRFRRLQREQRRFQTAIPTQAVAPPRQNPPQGVRLGWGKSWSTLGHLHVFVQYVLFAGWYCGPMFCHVKAFSSWLVGYHLISASTLQKQTWIMFSFFSEKHEEHHIDDAVRVSKNNLGLEIQVSFLKISSSGAVSVTEILLACPWYRTIASQWVVLIKRNQKNTHHQGLYMYMYIHTHTYNIYICVYIHQILVFDKPAIFRNNRPIGHDIINDS